MANLGKQGFDMFTYACEQGLALNDMRAFGEDFIPTYDPPEEMAVIREADPDHFCRRMTFHAL